MSMYLAQVLNEDTIFHWKRDRHFAWSSELRETLIIGTKILIGDTILTRKRDADFKWPTVKCTLN